MKHLGSVATILFVVMASAACSSADAATPTTTAPAATVSTTAGPEQTVAPVPSPAPSTSTGGALPTAICRERVDEAVAMGDATETVESFYPALSDCTGLSDWVAAVRETDALGDLDPIEFAAKVCGRDGPMLSVTCQEAMAAAPLDG